MATCKIDGCDRPARGRGWCHTHYMRWWKSGDPGPAESIRPAGEDHHNWSERPTYVGLHGRLRRERGHAGEHTCPCGAPAGQWAYDKADDPYRLVDDQGWPYSTDLDRYVALCASCHVRTDLNPPTHCKHGHEFTEANTWHDKHGHRRCRECNRANARRQYAKRKAAA